MELVSVISLLVIADVSFPSLFLSFQVHRLKAEGILTVKPEAQVGVADILDLNDFSAMSLLTTLRARYQRDEVYTFVGPILISINPYKWNHALYSEANMIHYHTSDADRLPPHLFKVDDVIM